jgi:hypothetical protein
VAGEDLLAEQTQLLFEKLDSMQMTLDEFRDDN